MSGDGSRTVSGSQDNTVRIWDMSTGKAIGKALRGHEDEKVVKVNFETGSVV